MELALVNYNEKFNDVTIEEWERAYEKLYGGFENLVDLSKEDEEEEDELEDVSDSEKTKSGYLKDEFVVTEVMKRILIHLQMMMM